MPVENCSNSKWVGRIAELSDASVMTRGRFPKAVDSFRGKRGGLRKRGVASTS